MPDFHEVRLPEDVERGASGGLGFKTRILELESGYEQRNIDWSQTKGEWDLSYGIMQMEDVDAAVTTVTKVRDFFYARYGRTYGFRFRDWSDYKIGDSNQPTIKNQLIGLGDGTRTQFQVFKRYSSGGFHYDRVIKKLVAGTVNVLLDGVVQGAGVTVDNNTGLVTFSVAPAASGGTGPGGEQVVSIACEFDVPVRFKDDYFRVTLQQVHAGSIPAINIREIRV